MQQGIDDFITALFTAAIVLSEDEGEREIIPDWILNTLDVFFYIFVFNLQISL